MNAELMRNLWLEASPRRLLIMAGILGLLFLTAAAVAPTEELRAVAITAETVFYVLVVLWGTRNAASSVVDEIRDRTWDLQRLSAITPWEMVWGKLLGSTSCVWFGGLICLVPITMHALADRGAGAAGLQLAYFLSVGLIAQSVSLWTSLVAVRRRVFQSRLGTFAFQLFGIIAAFQVFSIWSTAVPSALGMSAWLSQAIEAIDWYGMRFDAASFYLGSLAIFAAWVLAAAHQFMRQELQVSMNPLVWIGFLIFIAVYFAGFLSPAIPLSETVSQFATQQAALASRLFIAMVVLLSATYVSLFVMPKERVKMRWLATQFGEGRFMTFFGGLPGWAWGFAFTAIAGALAIGQLDASGVTGGENVNSGRLFVIAIMGELARNIGIVMFFNMLAGQRRGDFAAVLSLILLYTVLPALAGASEAGPLVMSLLSPWAEIVDGNMDRSTAPTFEGLSAISMWVQAAIIWPFAVLRLMDGWRR